MHHLLTARPLGRGLKGGRPVPDGDEPGAEGAVRAAAEEGGPGRHLCCHLCRQPVTASSEAIDVDRGHRHTFFNPAGLLFEIGCYLRAPGCAVVGDPTAEFSWFPAYRWSHALCRSCGAHLGWHFSSAAASSFFGLVVNRLVEMEELDAGG